MKKLLLLITAFGLLSGTFAQTLSLLKPVQNSALLLHNSTDKNKVIIPCPAYKPLTKKNILPVAGQRGSSYDTLGTAGNLFTIILGQVNSLAANPAINSITFIHRVDQTKFLADNIAQYMYDISVDGGNDWSINNGVLDPTANNVDTAGRYPNVAIYNPAGNTDAQNAYLSYLGAWLPYNNGATEDSTTIWKGFIAGVAQLNNNSNTFTEHITSFNNSHVVIPCGLCNGLPGEFWAADFSYDNSIDGILLYKGVWDSTIHDINWSLYQKITPPFNPNDTNGKAININMAFDPSGQFGWVVFTGDISTDTDYVFRPVFYHSTDGGATWNGPIDLVLDSLTAIKLNTPTGFANVTRPATEGSMDIAVDYKGNPHLETMVFPAVPHTFSYYPFGMMMYDFTLNAKGEWSALLLDSISTYDGIVGGSAGEIDADNRPQVSSTADGKKIIFGWLDTPPDLASGGAGNIYPDLLSRVYNVDNGLADTVVNETNSDPVWGNNALFATFAPTSFVQGNTIQVPTVFAQLNKSGLSTDPASFYYYKNTTHDSGAANINQDITPPLIYLKGCNPVAVLQGTTYHDAGATATDNVDGNLTANIQTTNATIATTTPGTYYVNYTVTDNAGNVYSINREVIVSTVAPALPLITLNGPDTVYVNQCKLFTDPGATAKQILVTGSSSDTIDITNTITTNAATIPFATDNSNGTPGTYNLVYTASNCSSTDSVTRTIIISDAPQINLLGGTTITIQPCDSFVDPGINATDCAGTDTVTSVNNIVNNIPGTYYVTYTANNGSISTITRTVIVATDTSHPTITFPDGDTSYVYVGTKYIDSLPSASACSGIASVTSNAGSVITDSPDTIQVTYTATDSNGHSSTANRTVIIGTEPTPDFSYYFGTKGYVFTDKSTNDPSAWLWNFGDGNGYSKQTPPVHPYLIDTTLQVCLTVSNIFNTKFAKPKKTLCDTIQVYKTGINQIALDNSFSLYPNPTSGKVTLDVNSAGFDKMDVSVFNLLGENVKTLNLMQIPAQSKYEIDLSNFSRGVYLVRIQTEKGTVTKKLTLFSGN